MYNLRQKCAKKENKRDNLDARELEEAETLWINDVQHMRKKGVNFEQTSGSLGIIERNGV